MLFELTIVPIGGDRSLSDEIAEVIKVIDDSGLVYQLTPSGTCIEGDWDEVMAAIRKCHDRTRQTTSHVITNIRIEDEGDELNQIETNISRVEDKLGKSASRRHSAAPG